MTPPRQKRKRAINWAAVEHVGNDADEGGFLGNEEAERERTDAKPVVPSPSHEAAPAPEAGAPISAASGGGAASAPSAHLASETDASSAGSTSLVDAESDELNAEAAHGEAAVEPAPEPLDTAQSDQVPPPASDAAAANPEPEWPAANSTAETADALASEQQADKAPVLFPTRAPRQRGVNDGPLFTAAGGEPPINRTKPRRAKLKPAQRLVVASFLDQRTNRSWAIWSGRLVPEVTKRLEDRAFDDAVTSERSRLKSGHYLDAALKALPDDPAEIVEVANTWLIDRWGGEHPPGINAQFSVSPMARDRLAGLKRSLRGYRHGIIIDVVCAAADRILDVLEQEGPMNS